MLQFSQIYIVPVRFEPPMYVLLKCLFKLSPKSEKHTQYITYMSIY